MGFLGNNLFDLGEEARVFENGVSAIDLPLKTGVALVSDVVFEVLEGKSSVRAGKREDEHQEGGPASSGAGNKDLIGLIGDRGSHFMDDFSDQSAERTK